MAQAKINQRVLYWVTSHPWLKLIALILAIAVWFYVQGEINQFK